MHDPAYAGSLIVVGTTFAPVIVEANAPGFLGVGCPSAHASGLTGITAVLLLLRTLLAVLVPALVACADCKYAVELPQFAVQTCLQL